MLAMLIVDVPSHRTFDAIFIMAVVLVFWIIAVAADGAAICCSDNVNARESISRETKLF